MRIHSMTATFGKLDHETLTLEPGLNLIDAPNEWGKSTWCAFIMAMFYGMDTRERTTKTALADKERYAPWSGKAMAGRMELEWQGRSITLERRSKGRVPMGEFRAYETETGLPVTELTGANCGQVLLGVERSVFARSGFIRGAQMSVEMNEELRCRLNALVTEGDEGMAAETLGEKLKELKNRCRYNRTGLIPQTQGRVEELERQLREYEQLSRQMDDLERQSRELEAQKPKGPDPELVETYIRQERELREAVSELEWQWARCGEQTAEPKPPKARRVLWIAGGICLLGALALLTVGWIPALAALTLGLGLILTGTLIPTRQAPSAEAEDLRFRLEAAREALRFSERNLREIRRSTNPEEDWQRQDQLRQLHLRLGQTQGRMSAIGEPEALYQELERLTSRLGALERTERALNLAISTLEEARRELQRRFAPNIARRAQELFSRLTDGRYDRLSLGQELTALAGARGEDTLHNLLWRSEGTVDQLYLSLRLAVAQELMPEAPLVLDDALVRFDDHRLRLALGLFEELAEEKQIILFSCRQISDCI